MKRYINLSSLNWSCARDIGSLNILVEAISPIFEIIITGLINDSY